MRVVPLFRVFDLGQHLFCVAFGFNLTENVYDLPFRRDQVRCAFYAFHFLAVHVLLFKDSERVGDLLVGIGQQGVRQIVFLFEFLLCRRGIGRDAENGQSGFLQFCICVAEPARFNGSTRSVGFRIKEQDHVLASKL